MLSLRGRGQTGLSLVGMLFTLVILGLMAALVLKVVDSQKKDAAPTVGLLNQLDRTNDGGALSGGAETSPPARGPGLAGAAAISACKANLAIVENAVATLGATGKELPTTIEELVSRGVISEVPTVSGYTMTLEVVDGRATGAVLVNGQPGAQGCG